nr:hypothetical protein CFP56_02768 [Quercus suber]
MRSIRRILTQVTAFVPRHGSERSARAFTVGKWIIGRLCTRTVLLVPAEIISTLWCMIFEPVYVKSPRLIPCAIDTVLKPKQPPNLSMFTGFPNMVSTNRFSFADRLPCFRRLCYSLRFCQICQTTEHRQLTAPSTGVTR